MTDDPTRLRDEGSDFLKKALASARADVPDAERAAAMEARIAVRSQEAENSTAAFMGQLEDQLRKRGGSNDGGASSSSSSFNIDSPISRS